MDAPTVTASATPPSLPEPPVAKRARTVDHTLLEDWPTSTARAALAASARAERATVVAAEIAARAAPAPDRTFETCRDATAVLELYASFAGDAAETSPARLAVAAGRRLELALQVLEEPAERGVLPEHGGAPEAPRAVDAVRELSLIHI